MTKLAILGPKTSDSTKILAEQFNITHLYYDRAPGDAEVIINYGYKGQKERDYMARFRSMRNKIIINKRPAINKYDACALAAGEGVLHPKNFRAFADIPEADRDNYIFKPYYSAKGKNIMPAREAMRATDTNRGYFQEKVTRRAYELRVSAFAWVDPDGWGVWKKKPGENVAPDQIAWNHDQGGRFQRVQRGERWNVPVGLERQAKTMAGKVLKALDLQFGAVDFIVDRDGQIYFIEVNMRPGFTREYGMEFYVNVFDHLTRMSVEQIDAMVKGVNVVPAEEPPVQHQVMEVEIDDRMEQARKNLDGLLTVALEKWQREWGTTVNIDRELITNSIVDLSTF